MLTILVCYDTQMEKNFATCGRGENIWARVRRAMLAIIALLSGFLVPALASQTLKAVAVSVQLCGLPAA